MPVRCHRLGNAHRAAGCALISRFLRATTADGSCAAKLRRTPEEPFRDPSGRACPRDRWLRFSADRGSSVQRRRGRPPPIRPVDGEWRAAARCLTRCRADCAAARPSARAVSGWWRIVPPPSWRSRCSVPASAESRCHDLPAGRLLRDIRLLADDHSWRGTTLIDAGDDPATGRRSTRTWTRSRSQWVLRCS